MSNQTLLNGNMETIKTVMPNVAKTLEELLPKPKFDLGDSVCVAITLRKPSNTGKVHEDEISVDADKDALRVSKELLKSAAFAKITSIDVQIRNYMREVCISSPKFIKGGMYLVPPTLVEAVDESVIAWFAQREEMIEQFIAEYPASVEEAKERLRALFNEAEYPAPTKLRAGFSHEIEYFSFKAANSLQKISKAIFDREAEKAQKKADEMVKDIEATLILQTQQIMSDLLNRIKGDEDGKQKMLKPATVQNWQGFFELLGKRNITGNDKLAQISEQANAILSGLTADGIKKSDLTRESLTNTFCELKGLLDDTVIDKPKRKITF